MNEYSSMNFEAKIVGLEKDIEFLKSGQAEFREFMKRFEQIPYKMQNMDDKMTLLLEEKRDINDKIDKLLERVHAVEVEEDSESDKQTKKVFDWSADWIKYVALALLGLIVILGSVLGVQIPFTGGK